MVIMRRAGDLPFNFLHKVLRRVSPTAVRPQALHDVTLSPWCLPAVLDGSARVTRTKPGPCPREKGSAFRERCGEEALSWREWAGMGSNHRKRELVDLQSTPFDHSGTYPKHANRLVRSGQVGNGKGQGMQGENDRAPRRGSSLHILHSFHVAAVARRVVWMGPMSELSIDAILDAAEQHQASDVFLQEGEIPRLKIREQIQVLGNQPTALQQMAALWQVCGADLKGDMDRDSGLISRSHIRFRVNLHRTMGRLGAVMRRIKTSIPALYTLGVPEWLLTRWAQRSFGLILVTGPTGTGKSTTIASLLQWMNDHLVRHIVTIEDPVEYVFTSNHSHFTQREVGRDTANFAQGLRSGMRQAPDVIFVGEIRDFETALTALQACETGLLVLATLHSERVADTMERFLNLFPQDQTAAGSYMLAHQLVGVQCQKLVPRVDGTLQLLVEHIENGGAMRDWIYNRDTSHIQDYLRRSTDPNAVSFLHSAVAAYEQGLITEEAAIDALGNETEFRRAARGIRG